MTVNTNPNINPELNSYRMCLFSRILKFISDFSQNRNNIIYISVLKMRYARLKIIFLFLSCTFGPSIASSDTETFIEDKIEGKGECFQGASSCCSLQFHNYRDVKLYVSVINDVVEFK